MVVFVDSFEGKSKEKGNPYQIVTLMEVRRGKEDGKLKARTAQFFVHDLDCEKIEPGDVVKPIFEESEFLGGKPELIGLDPKGENVFSEWL